MEHSFWIVVIVMIFAGFVSKRNQSVKTSRTFQMRIVKACVRAVATMGNKNHDNR